MRLAGKDQLNRMRLVLQQRKQPFRAAQEQRGTLVGGKPARKSDRQNVGVENTFFILPRGRTGIQIADVVLRIRRVLRTRD